MIVGLMGVTGSGKTTIGTLLAQHTGAMFADADDYHPLGNRQKLAAGQPLTDADREPWLKELNRLLVSWFEAGKSGVLACSALKASYRDMLSDGMPQGTVRFVVLDGQKEMIADRLAHRKHSYMNPALLDSQIATLEMPADALRVVNDRAPEEVVQEIVSQLAV
ncbi:MAG: gluconokinase [Acidobacteriota bacterium]|nr:gluconokinase [Acidobacteriota bacterium]